MNLDTKPKLKEKLAKMPQTIGIYYYKDKNNRILYIGKANNIQITKSQKLFQSPNPNKIDEFCNDL